MASRAQIVMINLRNKIDRIISSGEGSLDDRMMNCIGEIKVLSELLESWINQIGRDYRNLGCDITEFRDDTVGWLTQNQFYVDLSEPDIWRCHISATGWSRQIAFTISFGKPL